MTRLAVAVTAAVAAAVAWLAVAWFLVRVEQLWQEERLSDT